MNEGIYVPSQVVEFALIWYLIQGYETSENRIRMSRCEKGWIKVPLKISEQLVGQAAGT
jgi:hypothetical protein